MSHIHPGTAGAGVLTAVFLAACMQANSELSARDSSGEVIASAESASCKAYVHDVSPRSVPIDQWAHFLIQGDCLPSTLAFWVANCPDVSVEVDDSGDWAVATCWAGSLGSHAGVVKDRAGGTELESFTVDVYETN